MNTLFRKNEKGFSLIEVMGVFVVLGIIASIGLVSIWNVIYNSKSKIFVNNAISIVQAAELYLNDIKTENMYSLTKITYEDLFNLNYINRFNDPYTGKPLHPSTDTYVEVNNGVISSVCLAGEYRRLCTTIDNVTVDQIVDKPN